MTFSELMGQVFNSQWLGTVVQIVLGLLVLLSSKLTTKLKDKMSVYSSTVKELKEQNEKIKLELEKELEKNKHILYSIHELSNIVVMGFLDSKGVTANTKMLISETAANLKAIGVDLNTIKETVDAAKKDESITAEEVNKIIEEVQKFTKDTTETAKDIKNKTLDIYNEILDE